MVSFFYLVLGFLAGYLMASKRFSRVDYSFLPHCRFCGHDVHNPICLLGGDGEPDGNYICPVCEELVKV